MQDILLHLSTQLADNLTQRKEMICLAESCTGGLLAETFTRLSGSSDWFERGFIVYSNDAKHELLNVQTLSLKTFGAVSEEVAKEMAVGALNNSHADYAISITGIAGPNGGTEEKPVGTICFGFADKETAITKTYRFSGERQDIRIQSCVTALEEILNFIVKTET